MNRVDCRDVGCLGSFAVRCGLTRWRLAMSEVGVREGARIIVDDNE